MVIVFNSISGERATESQLFRSLFGRHFLNEQSELITLNKTTDIVAHDKF